MDIFNNDEDKINLTMVAYEVGMATLGKIIDYYNQMLLVSITQLSELSDKSPNEIQKVYKTTIAEAFKCLNKK